MSENLENGRDIIAEIESAVALGHIGQRWLGFYLALVLIFVACAPLTEASASPLAEVNRACRRASLESFQLMHMRKFSARGNLCRKPLGRLNPAIQETLTQVLDLNSQVENVMKRRGKRLVGRPFKLVIVGSPHAWVQGSSDGATIKIGDFQDWPGGALNAETYVHELAHMIAQNSVPALATFSKVSRELILIEGLADELALSVIGSLAPTDINLQGFPWQSRTFGSDKTFFLPTANFQVGMFAERIFQYCNLIYGSDSAPRRGVEFCDYSAKRNGGTFDRPEKLDMSPFDPAIGKDPQQSAAIDPHLISIPFLSFLQALKRSANLEKSPLLELLVASKNPRELESKYICEGQCNGRAHKIYGWYVDFNKLFYAVRSDFVKEHDADIYDQLFNAYGIALGLEFAANIAHSDMVYKFDASCGARTAEITCHNEI